MVMMMMMTTTRTFMMMMMMTTTTMTMMMMVMMMILHDDDDDRNNNNNCRSEPCCKTDNWISTECYTSGMPTQLFRLTPFVEYGLTQQLTPDSDEEYCTRSCDDLGMGIGMGGWTG